MSADGKSYISNFQIVGGTVRAEIFPNAYLPVDLHVDVAYNLGAGKNAGASDPANSTLKTAAGNEAFGMVAGISLGKLEESGNIMLGYSYKMVGTDSVFSAFNDDEVEGTNVAAHDVKVGFQLAPMTSLMASLEMGSKLVNASGAANPTHYTFRLNLGQKF
jgi:hypothetical protein